MTSVSKETRFWLVWHLLAAAMLLLAPIQLWTGEPFWFVEFDRMRASLILAAGYGFAAVALAVVAHRGGRPQAAITIAPSVLALCLLALLVFAPQYSRGVLLLGSGFFVVLIVTPLLGRRARPLLTAGLGLGLLAILGLGFGAEPAETEVSSLPESTLVALSVAEVEDLATSLHTVRITHHPFEESEATGGALDRVGDDILLVTGDGEFFLIRATGPDLQAARLGLQAPMNPEDFQDAVGSEVNLSWFRAAGLMVQEVGDSVRIVVSHHYWKKDEGCFVLRFSETLLERIRLTGVSPSFAEGEGRWHLLYETRPCLPLKDRGHPFAGHQSGGRIALLGDTALLVTVGDHEGDGWNSDEVLSQDPTGDYGKTLVVPLDGGQPRIFTMGHRNPQGILVEPGGRIWSTEHGPEGGDALNLLVDGENYGWPYFTYGTEYGETTWPLLRDLPEGESLRAPELAWIPSIGPSHLAVVRQDHFPSWQGDLLVASMRHGMFLRIHRNGGRIAYEERIPVGRRIRDFVEGPDGRLIVWADHGWILTVARLEEEEDASLVRLCTSCHSVGEPGQGMGPDLQGILGSTVASQEGYPYSEAFRELRGTWTEARLDQFLADPTAFAPGTSMTVPGLDEDRDRQVVIEYLRRLTPPSER